MRLNPLLEKFRNWLESLRALFRKNTGGDDDYFNSPYAIL